MIKLPSNINKIAKSFPTNSDALLHPKSYFRCVYSYLSQSKRFLEIGYRKGIFVEICKYLNIFSIHVDITDKLLRAIPTKQNACFTTDSLKYLSSCRDRFDLIFQDGAKVYKTRKKEYDLIMQNNILAEGGIILVDDLHYPSCFKAFKYAVSRYKLVHSKKLVYDKNEYYLGVLREKSNSP
ncbi:hypothetical protein LCGC14_0768950 [marine sediment metagenome]|uniref:Class I SAM-dependent methyltransferase n=1 Tax=marine sediment metagenome TaxID=412755 RepID=A0A0F9PYZ4_9ZZZZ